MPDERYQHIYLPGPSRIQGYTVPPKNIRNATRIPSRENREEHSRILEERFHAAWQIAEQRQTLVRANRNGAYIDFNGEPGFHLAVKSLENIRSGVRIRNVRSEGEGDQEQTYATVYVPRVKSSYFLDKFELYANPAEDTDSGQPSNKNLVNSIADIRQSELESFWQPMERDFIPRENTEIVEVWLGFKSEEQEQAIRHFDELLAILGIGSEEGILKFPERAVKLINANRTQLEQLITHSDNIAEFKIAKKVATYFVELETREQLKEVQEMLGRVEYNLESDVSVCILDTGVNNGHPLLENVLSDDDLHAVNEQWGTDDHYRGGGHGTPVAGLAAYGDLLDSLNENRPLIILHRLESSKIFPPGSEQNEKSLWGYMTAQGISKAEIQAPNRTRIICMASTAEGSRGRGNPTSWSAEIDSLASGQNGDDHRLIVISAGNNHEWVNYPDANLTSEVQDPGQAWNGLTVGSYTNKARILHQTLEAFEPIAPEGGLSPHSTTSYTWPALKWPIKPEVLFEGGNVALGPNESILNHEDLRLLSTSGDISQCLLQGFDATSASTALAACMAAKIQVEYPSAWPETVRALIVHSAEWTNEMRDQFLPRDRRLTKADYGKLLRICGYGVPDLERAMYCASNSLTLVSQAELQPYEKINNSYKTNDMHLYNLPWPTDILLGLGAVQVSMRITLSYFIEPGPGEVGWKDRYRYPSHALRFDLNSSGESEEEFVQRINYQARDDGESPGTDSASASWVIGATARDVGSIHSDIWQGTAADLATSNRIAIFPVVGWWRERSHLRKWDSRCRYSLIVSIHAPEQDIDIYTPVLNLVRVPIPVEIRTNR